MALESLIPVIVFLIVLSIIWGILSKMFKVFFYVSIAFFVFFLITGFVIYQDATEFREKFVNEKKIILLVDENEIITGFNLNEETELISVKQKKELSELYKKQDFESMLGDSFKLMLIKTAIFDELKLQSIEVFEEELAVKDTLTILKSDDTLDALENALDEELRLQQKISDEELKSYLFSILVAEHVLGKRNPIFFYLQFKKGNIIIYPETALFRAIKLIPTKVLKDVASSILAKTKETASELVVEHIEE